MKKTIFSILLLMAAGLFLCVSSALASETTGEINVGVQTGMEGVVKAAPTASPVAGEYRVDKDVTLTASGSSAICYTTDGTTPVCATATTCTTGTKYVSAISVTSTKTIKSAGCYADASTGPVATDLYTIKRGGGGGGIYVAPASIIPQTTTTGEVVANADVGGKTTITNTVDNTTVLVELPANAVSTDTTITITQIPATYITVSEAVAAIPGTKISVGSYIYNFTAMVGTTAVTTFNQAITLTFTYTDAQIAELDESTLQVYYWQESTKEWVALTTTVDVNTNTLTASTTHFTNFTILGDKLAVVSAKNLIKVATSPATYWIYNSQRHVFPHLNVYLSWDLPKDFSTVKTISLAEFNSYSEGDPVPFRDGSMFRGTAKSLYGKSASAVFYVEDGKLRPIKSAAIYQALFKDTKWKKVTWVPDNLLTKFSYPLGETISLSTTHPNGSLVKYPDSSAVYLIANGKKSGFASWQAFVDNGYKQEMILTISRTETYPDSDELIDSLVEALTLPKIK